MGTSRKTATTLEARVEAGDAGLRLLAPRPGYWRARPAVGALVTPGAGIGELEELGQVYPLRAPAGAFGVVVEVASPELARAPVDHRTALMRLDPEAAVGGAAVQLATSEAELSGPVFRTPLGGRYYARPAPDAEPFVGPGDLVEAGRTVALIEVMKTFNRVKYEGEPARVARVVPEDGDDVEVGDVLLELEGPA